MKANLIVTFTKVKTPPPSSPLLSPLPRCTSTWGVSSAPCMRTTASLISLSVCGTAPTGESHSLATHMSKTAMLCFVYYLFFVFLPTPAGISPTNPVSFPHPFMYLHFLLSTIYVMTSYSYQFGMFTSAISFLSSSCTSLFSLSIWLHHSPPVPFSPLLFLLMFLQSLHLSPHHHTPPPLLLPISLLCSPVFNGCHLFTFTHIHLLHSPPTAMYFVNSWWIYSVQSSADKSVMKCVL